MKPWLPCLKQNTHTRAQQPPAGRRTATVWGRTGGSEHCEQLGGCWQAAGAWCQHPATGGFCSLRSVQLGLNGAVRSCRSLFWDVSVRGSQARSLMVSSSRSRGGFRCLLASQGSGTEYPEVSSAALTGVKGKVGKRTFIFQQG